MNIKDAKINSALKKIINLTPSNREIKEKKTMKKKELINADDANLFWVNGNGSLRNLKELADSLSAMSEETFAYHVNAEKNDFASWVKEVLLDSKLAVDLKKVKTRTVMLKKVEARLKANYIV